MAAQASAVKTTSPAIVAVAWMIVVLPTLWGLNYTVQNAMKLFKPPAPAIAAPATPGAAAAH